MKNSLCRLVNFLLFFLILQNSAIAGGIPTYDAAAVIQMQQTVLQLKEQYQQLKKQYDAVTGNYGRGLVGLNDAIRSSSVVPGSWQEVVSLQRQGVYSTKQAAYEKIIKTLPQDFFQATHGKGVEQTAVTYQLSTDSVRAALAGGDTLYSEVQTHLNNLKKLGQQIDSTSNLKDAQDLQNRITTENGLLQSAIAKLNVMNMNLQANLLNQHNQATSAMQQYFKRSK